MKKTIVLAALALSLFSCNDKTAAPSSAAFKTAYVDTSKLIEEYTEAKDIEAKYKAKSDEMGGELKAEYDRWKSEAASFQKNAQANGQAWAQQKGAELQKREQQLNYAQQAMIQQLQQESGAEMDTLVKNVKKFVKEYGKEKGYDYVFATGDAVSILYAKDQYDITKEVIKLLDEKYKNGPKNGEKEDVKAEAKKELDQIKNSKK